MNNKLNKVIKHINELELVRGDKTNFGTVLKTAENSITFKAKDTPKTRITFNKRKFGRNEYVLSQLIKL